MLSSQTFSVARTVSVFIVITHWITTGAMGQGASARWARGVGGIGDDYGWSVATDSDRNVYVAGYFSDLAAFGPTNFTSHGGHDIFVLKYDHNGNPLWATRAGGPADDQGRGVLSGSSGEVYLTGYFRSNGVFGATNVASRGAEDVFLAKLDSSGRWLWTTTAGGVNTDEGRSVAVDGSGNCYIAGIFFGSAAFGTNVVESRGQSDIVVAKASAAGEWLWARSFGGAGLDESRGVAVSARAECYVTGYFSGTSEFPGTNLMTRGGSDIFLAKFSGDGELLWVQQAGGPSADEGHAVTLDAGGHLYVTGGFAGTANVFGTNLIAQGSSGETDVFLVKLDASGDRLWLQRGTGASQDSGNAVVIDRDGNSYITGLFVGSVAFGSQRLMSTSGQSDVFFAKYSPEGNFLWAFQAGGPAYMSGNGLGVDAEGSAYGTGFYRSGTTIGGLLLTNSSSGARDAFIVRVDGPPRLRIARSGQEMTVAWPVWANGYQLQNSAGLEGTNVWTIVTNVLAIQGEERQVAPKAGGQRGFFRLRSP